MKKVFLNSTLCLVLFLLQSLALARSIDFLPTSLKFRVGLDDDVSMSRSQHVYIYIKNIGRSNYTHHRGYRIRVKLNSNYYWGYIYGPDHRGGSLGGTIRRGETGKIFVRLPLRTLRHCGLVKTRIDTLRRIQVGGRRVFLNDSKKMMSIDMTSRIRCLRPILTPIPRPIIRKPLPKFIVPEIK